MIFYYSGHGVVLPETADHLMMCIDWQEDGPSSFMDPSTEATMAGYRTLLALETIASAVGSGSVVALMDTCRSCSL